MDFPGVGECRVNLGATELGGEWTHGKAQVPHATAQSAADGSSAHEGSACEAF